MNTKTGHTGGGKFWTLPVLEVATSGLSFSFLILAHEGGITLKPCMSLKYFLLSSLHVGQKDHDGYYAE